jgi:hypothetical protein
MSACQSLAPGVRARLTKTSKKAAAKAASRFYDNDAVSLRDLGALMRPDGNEAARRESHSPLRIEYVIAEAEADKFNSDSPAKWNVKITNSAAPERREVSGKLSFERAGRRKHESRVHRPAFLNAQNISAA